MMMTMIGRGEQEEDENGRRRTGNQRQGEKLETDSGTCTRRSKDIFFLSLPVVKVLDVRCIHSL